MLTVLQIFFSLHTKGSMKSSAAGCCCKNRPCGLACECRLTKSSESFQHSCKKEGYQKVEGREDKENSRDFNPEMSPAEVALQVIAISSITPMLRCELDCTKRTFK
jgi:hypothetical protein